jgi:subtilisin family serine protease
MARFKQLGLGIAAAAFVLMPIAAQASIRDTVNDLLGQLADVAHPDAVAPAVAVTPRPAARVKMLDDSALQSSNLPEFNIPSLPSEAVAELPNPSVETPLKRLFCVEYARARSGLAVFGDAKFWWARAKSLYARASDPVENAVMVFSASKRLRLGHVAVVTRIVSRREIRVDQANWQNHGEIDHSTPVRDVSARNDWSQVRVWDMGSAGFGTHVYAVSGFIAKELTRQALN